tara:strand:+ start:90 stop:263 length:174 start_codon:yes stop_codon:yes gene_type:complete
MSSLEGSFEPLLQPLRLPGIVKGLPILPHVRNQRRIAVDDARRPRGMPVTCVIGGGL